MRLVRVVAIAAACLHVAVGASAQTPYAGAALFGDIVRSTHTETAGVSGSDGGGEAIGFALRAGTRLGAVWGVELEFARPSSIEDEGDRGVVPLSFSELFTFEAVGRPSDFSVTSRELSLIFPPIIGFRSHQRNTTLSAVAWAEQVVSARVSLVYLGGLAFVRSQHEYSASYSPLLSASPIVFPPYATETVRYGVGPVVGFEARLALTDRAQLVPGIRLHAIDDTWLVRPAVGINWKF